MEDLSHQASLSGKLKSAYTTKAVEAEVALENKFSELENLVERLASDQNASAHEQLKKFADDHSIPHDSETSKEELAERVREFLAKMKP